MRSAFGLVGLLVAVGIIIILWSVGFHPADQVQRGQPAKEQAQQWAGVTEDGVKVRDTIRYSSFESGGRFRGLMIDEMTPQSPMRTFYHLKENDVIIEAMEMTFKDYSFDEAKAFVETAYQRTGRITILRDGQRIRLTPTPDELLMEVIGGVAPTTEQPQEQSREQIQPETPARQPAGNALNRQLDAITKPR